MATAADVAKYLIRLAASDEEGEQMTVLRLQKLLYYCQGWKLAWTGRPLFTDRIEAWRHGPVVRSVHHSLGGRGAALIGDQGEPAGLSAEDRADIERVWKHYRQFSAWGLRDLAHREAPWKDHFRPDPAGRCEEEIPPSELRDYFAAEYERLTGEPADAEERFAREVAEGRTVPLQEALRELGW